MTPPPPHQAPDAGASTGVLLREVADLLAVDPAECPDAVKRERVLLMVELSGRLDASIAREVGVFDANTVWAGDGTKSATAWLHGRSELAPAHASAIVHNGRDIRSCPRIEHAWNGGVLGTDKVRLLLRARDIHPGLFATDEAFLVRELAPLTFNKAAARIAEWSAIAEATRDAEAAERAGDDPDDVGPDDPAEQNTLHISQSLDGRWFEDGNYDAVTGAEIANAITALVDAKFAAGVYRADDGMTPANRRAECKHELLMRGANPDATKHGEPRPSVIVEVDAKSLAGLPITDLADAATRHCRLDNGTPIPRTTAERLLCNCHLTTILTQLGIDDDPETLEVLGITDLLRDATRAQRRALRKRDRGCVFPGCHAPVDWCQAHHLWQHEQLGPTCCATSSCSAGTTTTSSTKAAGTSGETPTTSSSTSASPTAPPSPWPTTARRSPPADHPPCNHHPRHGATAHPGTSRPLSALPSNTDDNTDHPHPPAETRGEGQGHGGQRGRTTTPTTNPTNPTRLTAGGAGARVRPGGGSGVPPSADGVRDPGPAAR